MAEPSEPPEAREPSAPSDASPADDASDSSDARRRLALLVERIDLAATEPDRIERRFTRFARPLLKLVGYEPTVSTRALSLAVEAASRADLAGLRARLPPALTELEKNVARAERAAIVHGRLPVSHASWLARLAAALRQSHQVAEGGAGEAARLASGLEPALLAPPLYLSLAKANERSVASAGPSSGAAGVAPREPEPPSRLLELELAAIDHVLDAARQETATLERRRRLFEAARRLLLDAAASLPVGREGVDLRARFIAGEIATLSRLEAAGVSPRVTLAQGAKRALGLRERGRLLATLAALDGAAVRAGDAHLARLAARALSVLTGGRALDDPALVAASRAKSHDEVLGPEVASAVRQGYERLRAAYAGPAPGAAATVEERELHRLAQEYLTPGAESASLHAGLATDGCFEVGGTLSPVRVEEVERHARLVRYPTQDLVLVRATEPADLVSAVIDDPRTLVLSLATGRLLTRKYVEVREHTKHRTVKKGEVRIYVLDGSSSMVHSGEGGARARMRDAIMTSELATTMKRLADPSAETRLTLYYRYFTRQLGPLCEVSTANQALLAIADVAGTMRGGGTDIEGALRDSFELVGAAQRRGDAELARAQIVLVTDGEDSVSAERVLAARASLGTLPIGVSVIALGDENPALRALVAHQRARGERAFYHHLDDALLGQLARGELRRAELALHLPDDVGPELGAVAAELEGLLEELSLAERARALDASSGGRPGEREAASAREEALRGETRALGRRFDRWFPNLPHRPQGSPGHEGGPTDTLVRPSEEADDVDAMLVVLGTLTEVLGELGGLEHARPAFAIELLHRLLPDARLTAARWDAALRRHPALLARPIASVRAAVGRA